MSAYCRTFRRLKVTACAVGAVILGAAVITPTAGADTIGPISFETSQGYVVGDINGQPTTGSLPNGRWSKTGPYDAAVALVSAFPAAAGYGYGSQALRISDAVTSGSFGDQTFSPGLADEAGETGADNAGLSGGVRQPRFDASFLIGTTQATQQCPLCATPLHMSVSPDRGDGARMSYLRFDDLSNGVHVYFDDVTDPGPLGAPADFNERVIGTLGRTTSHTIRLTIDFNDGPGNDVVQVFIDNTLAATGGTWEDYYRFDPEQAGGGNLVPTVDKVLFRESGTANAGNAGQGFLIDNLGLTSAPTPTATTGGGGGGTGGVAGQTGTKAKKCKKKKHKRSAEAAKKRCKKHKKH
jgi:hypothetical protein